MRGLAVIHNSHINISNIHPVGYARIFGVGSSASRASDGTSWGPGAPVGVVGFLFSGYSWFGFSGFLSYSTRFGSLIGNGTHKYMKYLDRVA